MAMLIGSAALRHWYPESRKPRDLDFLINKDELADWLCTAPIRDTPTNPQPGKTVCRHLNGTVMEFETDEIPSTAALLAMSPFTDTADYGLHIATATPEMLMLIKRSHVYWRHKWATHIGDYAFLKSKGVCIPASLDGILQLRIAEHIARGPYRPVNLNMSNDEFFAKSEKTVARHFVHDDLHLAVMYYDAPLFTRAKRDQSKAKLEQDLFGQFSFQDQCRLVREEAYVIGLERIVVPLWAKQSLLVANGVLPAIQLHGCAESAYNYALMRISTNLTKGWFREFAIENHDDVKEADVDYIGKFLSAIDRGSLKPIAAIST